MPTPVTKREKLLGEWANFGRIETLREGKFYRDYVKVPLETFLEAWGH